MTLHIIDLPDWAIARGAALNTIDALDPTRTALVAIDMQRVFTEPDEVFGNPHALAIIPALNAAATAIRASGGRVIWTRQTVAEDGPCAMPAWQYDLSQPAVARAVAAMRPGTASHALHPAMAVAPEDAIVDKYRYGAFSCPAGGLAAALDGTGIDTLVIAGTLTNCCCDSTAREGNMRGNRILFLADATATQTDAEHNAALLCLRLSFADVRRTAELPDLLRAR